MLVTSENTPARGQILLDSTNVFPKIQGVPLPTPPEDVPSKKRLLDTSDETPTKRPRLTRADGEPSDDDESLLIKTRVRRHTTFDLLQTSSCRVPATAPQSILPTRPILQSFVSSHRFDVFKCPSLADDRFMTPPYACSYSYGAKKNGNPILAVATEQGSVLVFNTVKRSQWDFEPQRTTFQPHDNGIFDVKWSLDDSMLATASGDKSARIYSVETQNMLYCLRTHTSSVKCIAWDPSHRDLLSTGSRDGGICVWDLRVASVSRDASGRAAMLEPVITVPNAHGQEKSKGGRRKVMPLPRSVTSILYSDTRTHALASAGSFDGVLNLWDLRLPIQDGSIRLPSTLLATSPADPTTMNGSSRARGISSLCAGSGPASGLVFALGADSRLYTYSSSSLIPLDAATQPNLRASFYVRLATSPCGRWLATGCSGKNGSVFLFDVANSARLSSSSRRTQVTAVELRGQAGEVGAVDWASETLATCADDGTVRIWRPNCEVHQNCLSDPEAQRWNWSWSEEYPCEK